ncbi:holo-ACP synthase [Microbacterium aurum]
MTIRGIGIDVADVERFRELYRRYGSRFAHRWFTAQEIGRCCRGADPGAALAEHFAAKEAVWKALGPRSWADPLPWKSIEFHPARGTASLDGAASELAGAVAVHVCVARQQGVAVATALVSSVATVTAR